MSAARARKEAAKRLGIALGARYRDLVEANGPEEIQVAAIQLGDLFNQNVEFVIQVLKSFGGMEVKFEPLTRAKPTIAANDPPQALPEVPALFRAGADVDRLGEK